ncbi:MAG: PIG-L family deacetylase [bacterium]|nr:PIG-L family deacetylase [bacterium]
MAGIVFFSPHPDDVEFVLGGTVLLHCNRYPTEIVVMTDGGAAANGTKEIRRLESDMVASVNPNIHYTHLGFADMSISSYNEDQLFSIISVIRKFKPSIIVLPSSNDLHPDHIQTSLLVKKSVEMAASSFCVDRYGSPYNCKYLLSYRFPGKTTPTDDCWAKIYLDVSGVYEEKKKLIKTYKSQILMTEGATVTDVNRDLLSIIESTDRINGNKIGVCYAEELCLVKGSLGSNNLFKLFY